MFEVIFGKTVIGTAPTFDKAFAIFYVHAGNMRREGMLVRHILRTHFIRRNTGAPNKRVMCFDHVTRTATALGLLLGTSHVVGAPDSDPKAVGEAFDLLGQKTIEGAVLAQLGARSDHIVQNVIETVIPYIY